MRRRPAAGAVVALAICASWAPSAAAQAPPEVTLRTVPPMSGVHIEVHGGAFTTGRDGQVAVPLEALAPVTRTRVLEGTVEDAVPTSAKVRSRPLADGGVARLDRFFGTTLALGTYYRIRPRFMTVAGRRIPPEEVDSYTLRSRHGVVLTARGDQSVTLKASRVVRLARELVSKPIEWSVESVMVDGANVVNRSQLRFDPRKLDGRLDIELLFFSARITSRDALFGFPSGSEVVLTHPNGKTSKHRLDKDGALVLRSLPRGDYTVEVDAPGMAPPRPVALSRDQVVELKVLSYLDLGLAGGLMGAFAVGLLVLRRPHLRRLPRRRRAVGEGVALGPVDAA